MTRPAWLRIVPAMLLGLVPWIASCEPGPRVVWRPERMIQAQALTECSGIVRSRQYANVFWAHNDSGDMPRLFALDRNAELIQEIELTGARNVDWEDITTDDAGRLYIGDFGNNRNDRRDLTIYVVREPDPRAGSTAIDAERRIAFHFPEQTAFPDPDRRNFDCEALFWARGELYVLTKHRSDARTVLYRIPLASEGDRAAQRIAAFEAGSMVTAADASLNGDLLAVLSYQYLDLFERPKHGDNYFAGRHRRTVLEARQCEAICFDDRDIVFANEQREVFRIPVALVGEQSRFLPEPPRISAPRVQPVVDGEANEWPATWASLVLAPELLNPSTVAPEPPAARVAWSPKGLLVYVHWNAISGPPGPPAESLPLVSLMWGAESALRPRLSPQHQVCEAVLQDGTLRFQPDDALQFVSRKDGDGLILEALLPPSKWRQRLRSGQTLAFNLLVRVPCGSEVFEWAWAGSSSTQPLENPLLWGLVDLGDAPSTR